MTQQVNRTLQPLIDELRAIWATEPDTEARMRKAQPLMARVTADPALQARSREWPDTTGQNLLFYEDPDYGFVLNGVVRVPAYRGGVHDHAYAWTLYGVVDGTESLERYDQLDDGSRPGVAELRLAGATPGTKGVVDIVPPYAVHAERGGPTRSAALILRSERLVGKTLQRHFDLEQKTVREASGPEQVPYDF
jgi:predicted metal-dependent enzyme (double-stranded beta helix superfamily)